MFITAVIHLDSNGKHFLPATARIEWISTLLFVSLLVGLLGSSCSPICSQSRSSLFFLIPLLRTFTLYISDFLKGDLLSFISPSSGRTDRMLEWVMSCSEGLNRSIRLRKFSSTSSFSILNRHVFIRTTCLYCIFSCFCTVSLKATGEPTN